MSVQEIVSQFFPKKKTKREHFFSLLFDQASVAGAVWTVTDSGQATVIASGTKQLSQESWEDRIQAADVVIAKLEDKAGTGDIFKVILGLPMAFLTPEGDIKKELRSEIKNLAQVLDLKPIGFVSIPQALVHKLKKDEGIPPSVILMHVAQPSISIELYKVGSLVEHIAIEHNESFIDTLEATFKSFKNVEVLPSRILLYGLDTELLELVQRSLMRHPWTTKANFLHFPKIEILGPEVPAIAVSFAGAAELAKVVSDVPSTSPEHVSQTTQQPAPVQRQEVHIVDDEVKEEQQEEPTDEDMVEESETQEDANVVMVKPEALGFQKNVDVLERQQIAARPSEKPESKMRVPNVSLPSFSFSKIKIPRFLKGNLILPIIVGGGILSILLFSLTTWVLPTATVTVYQMPKAINQLLPVTVDPSVTAVDGAAKVVPGKVQEKSISGDKTIAVTGKKNVGDPAKGTVSIYNKSLSSRTFKKGAVLSSGSIQFTLDSDIIVASASESVGSITFGKGSVDITAANIGANGNVPAATEFTFKDASSSIAVARNDQALTGGTSKEVTVVSRTDYDNLIKELTKELVEQAKSDLSGSVGGGENLIDATIKTAVTEKVFDQELDEQVSQLHGKITVTVSGITYNQTDLLTLAKQTPMEGVPADYQLLEEHTQVVLADVQVKKDETITAKARVTSLAVPSLSADQIKKDIVGKKVAAVEEYLRNISGVGAADVQFQRVLRKDVLPGNANNITVKISIQQ